MVKILLDKKEALRIALTILDGEKKLEDYGGTALIETKLILKNILETLVVEQEIMMARLEPPKPKPKKKPKKPNKKVSEAEMSYFSQILNGMDESDKEGLTILDLEKGKDEV
ncbi:MAG: hypothetical protein CMI54_07395 [Parcubacteria group bacterium]|nr:hypothetical protein [Parcubacteria group bacterium]|tara:strand:- start:101 stop:436 length:336 start_codon:yes stop_codon:yes gene_type:complete